VKILNGFIKTLTISGSTLKCYHCLERPKSTEKHLSCAYFDKSNKYHKECTHSTFCMKRTSLYQLHNGSMQIHSESLCASFNCWNFFTKKYVDINVFSAFITIYVHKCADQSHRTMVQDKNGDWNWAQLLRFDLYNEGCFPHSNPSLLTTETSHCFCTSDFCNGSSFTKPSVHLISYTLVAVLFMIPLSAFVIS
jgi:hypothetical protein